MKNNKISSEGLGGNSEVFGRVKIFHYIVLSRMEVKAGSQYDAK